MLVHCRVSQTFVQREDCPQHRAASAMVQQRCEGRLIDNENDCGTQQTSTRCEKRPNFGLQSDKKKRFCKTCRPSADYVSLKEKAPAGGWAQACCCNKQKTNCEQLRHEHDAKAQVHIPTGPDNAGRALAMLSGRGLCLDADKVRTHTLPELLGRAA